MSKKISKILFWGGLLIGGFLIYYSFNPAYSKFFPKCPFLLLTHLKCPGCGSQRALHALLNGNLSMAWQYNMLLVASLPYIILLLIGEITKGKHPHFYSQIQNRWIIISYFILVILWWISRNIWNL